MNEWDERSFDWPGMVGRRPLVVEVGGFEGRWVLEMAQRYPGEYHIFEPQDWANGRIERRMGAALRSGSDMHIHPYALGVAHGQFQMAGWGTDANSFLKNEAFFERWPEEQRNARHMAMMRRVEDDWPQVFGDRQVDVLCMNIEGYEFVLLPEMARCGILPRIDHLMVQFHDGYDVPIDEAGVRAILAETHDILWDYGSTLACWERRA